MSVVAEFRAASRAVAPSTRWRVTVASTAAEAAAAWDVLEATGAGTVYQSRRFLEPWLAHVAPMRGIHARLGIVSDPDGSPVALLPFGMTRRGPLRVATFLGGRDSNLNLPLVDSTFPVDEADARTWLRLFAAALGTRVDLLVLSNQPRSWRGRMNAFAFAGSRPSPSNAFGATLGVDADFEATASRAARKKLRAKAAHLAGLGPVSYGLAMQAEVPALIETFVTQKQMRLARRGVDAGLDSINVRAFLTALAAPADGPPVLDLYVLRVNGNAAAVFGGLAYGHHWHGLINSYDDTPAIARCSPGELLLRYALTDLARRGFTSFDLGIGEARYKNLLCDETIELVDTIVPLTAAGHVFAAGEALRLKAKGAIKRRAWALGAVRQLQATLRPRLRPHEPPLP